MKKQDKKVLVTGGTGSIGGAVVRLLVADPKISEVVVFSRDEFKQHEQKREISSPKLRFIIGDVRNKKSIFHACRGIDEVYHTAALKHVHLGEVFPEEFMETNVNGTINVFDAVEECGVKKVVLLSTDKSANATSVLGMTKGLAEKILASRAEENKGPIFLAVRLGNVAASRGSVIPLFVEKIKKNEDLPVTDPLMTRFILSLSGTAEFMRFVMEHGKSGEIFVKKSAVVNMGNLAQALITIFHSDSKIKIVGVRPGEKTHEILLNRCEHPHTEEHKNCFVVHSEPNSPFVPDTKRPKIFSEGENFSSDMVTRLSLPETEKFLLSLEYIKNELKNS